MPNTPSNLSVAHGRLTHGLEANALVNRTLDFVYNELSAWRDRPGRAPETDEETLNTSLNRHLNISARNTNFPVVFQSEEKQTARRRVDISAAPADFAGTFIGSTFHGADDPFLIFEAKRLPPPGGKIRKREYVTGEPDLTGGIQRFKRGLHGAKLPAAVLIGYVQSDCSKLWHRRINVLIRALARRKHQLKEEYWTAIEQLTPLSTSEKRTSQCRSEHPRLGAKTATIQLHHMWVEMEIQAAL